MDVLICCFKIGLIQIYLLYGPPSNPLVKRWFTYKRVFNLKSSNISGWSEHGSFRKKSESHRKVIGKKSIAQAAPGNGRAGEGRARESRAGEGRAGEGRTGEGRTGQGRAGKGRAGKGRTGGRPRPWRPLCGNGRSVETAAPGKKKGVLKVSKFQKKIFLLSFEPKNGQNYVLISALASKNWLNQKNEDSLLYKSGGILPLFFDLTNFKSLRQKSKNIFIRFFVSNEN